MGPKQDEVFAEIHAEYSDIRDLGDRILAVGQIRMRGKGSGAETESLLASVTDHENGKAIRIWELHRSKRGP